MEQLFEKIKLWYLKNEYEIQWFLIGALVMDGFHVFGKGGYVGAVLSWLIAYFLYHTRKNR